MKGDLTEVSCAMQFQQMRRHVFGKSNAECQCPKRWEDSLSFDRDVLNLRWKIVQNRQLAGK